MKACILFTTFVAALWLIAVAGYTFFECSLEARGLDPLFAFPFREELLNALNTALPLAAVGVVILMKVNHSSPVDPLIFRLCLLACVMAAFLGLKAKRAAYPDPADPMVAEAIWWLPN